MGQQLVEVARGVDQVLQVVEYEQPLAVAEVVDQGLQRNVSARQLGPGGHSDPGHDELGLGYRRQRHEDGAGAEVLPQPLADRDREPRLPDPTRPGERDQTHVAAQDQAGHVVDGLVPADQRRGRRRQPASAILGQRPDLRCRRTRGACEALAQERRQVVADQPPELTGRPEPLVGGLLLHPGEQVRQARFAIGRRCLHVQQARHLLRQLELVL